MFNTVPPANAYMMKMILHDWNDEECVQILSNCPSLQMEESLSLSMLSQLRTCHIFQSCLTFI